jgi:predicted nucleotidyltransferase
MTSVALDEAHLAEVQAILDAHLPGKVNVRVFGSRAGGSPKRTSDLDLLLEAEDILPLSLIATLADAFDESRLPFKVDLIDRRAVSKSFGAIVDATSLAFPR